MTWQRGRRLRGQRPLDERIRIARRPQQRIEVSRRPIRRPAQPNAGYVVVGFAALILLGTALLMLPISSRAPGSVEWSTALFTATSAVCVTGLTVVDTHDTWSAFGQAVILLLLQLGGLGFMTSSTILLMLFGRRLSLGQRVVMAESLGRLGNMQLRTLITRIVLATLAVEAVGALLVGTLLLLNEGQLEGREAWRGLFVAVSAFNNAGFDIEGEFRSLAGHRGNFALLAVVALLITLGGTGYAIWVDVLRSRSWARLTVETKLVLVTSGTLLALGAGSIFVFEALGAGALREVSRAEALAASIFMSVSARTAGFAVFDLAELSETSRLLMMGLMFIGGAPVSTAGGIKLTTFSVLLFAILASLRGTEQVTAFDRSISHATVQRALAIALLSVAVVFTLALLLAGLLEAALSDVAFEAVSAFGTVGLSTGVTPSLDVPARLVVSAGMFVGRLGPLTLALALAGRQRGHPLVRYPEQPVSIS